MSEELCFFLFLIERYAKKTNQATGDVFLTWEKAGIVQEIYDSYFEYHQENLDNAFMDIDCLLKTKKHAW